MGTVQHRLPDFVVEPGSRTLPWCRGRPERTLEGLGDGRDPCHRIRPRSADRLAFPTGRSTELGEKHGYGGSIVALLGSGVHDSSRTVDDEVAAQLEGVGARSQQPLASDHQSGVTDPHFRVEPYPSRTRATHPPAFICLAARIDEDGERDVEAPEEALADALGIVVDDEHDSAPGRLDLVLLPEHLHEVRATDQSAGVAQEADEHRAAAELFESEGSSLERRQSERRRRTREKAAVSVVSHDFRVSQQGAARPAHGRSGLEPSATSRRPSQSEDDQKHDGGDEDCYSHTESDAAGMQTDSHRAPGCRRAGAALPPLVYGESKCAPLTSKSRCRSSCFCGPDRVPRPERDA